MWKQWRTAHKHDCQNSRSILSYSYLKISRDCHQRMVKAEIDLDWEMIEMVDVMKDFESEDRRLVFDEGIVI